MECSHPPARIEIRKFPPAIGGVPTFRRQCLDCFEMLDRRGLDPLNLPGGVLARDVVLCKFKPKKRTHTGFGGRGNSKRQTLEAFYRSAFWRGPNGQRARVLARDGFQCICGAPATCAAHIRYSDPLESTPDRDVRASCKGCNDDEREQRITRGVLGG